MLGNLKEFISVVQDGLRTNNNIRQTFQEVQKVTNIFKDNKQQKVSCENKVNYGAGGALLEKYQEQWAELHENADRNAKAAEDVDKLIIDLHNATATRLQHASDLAQNLAYLPNLTASVAQCIDSLKNVQSLMKTVEEELVEFEDIVERSKMEKWKLDHQYHLCLYKEKKMAALEEIKCKLAKDNVENSYKQERRQLAELQVWRDESSVAFQQDMAHYRASGSVPQRKMGCPSSTEITLDQVQLDDDRSDLEQFLES